jgi:filamentous hemagglutinin
MAGAVAVSPVAHGALGKVDQAVTMLADAGDAVIRRDSYGRVAQERVAGEAATVDQTTGVKVLGDAGIAKSVAVLGTLGKKLPGAGTPGGAVDPAGAVPAGRPTSQQSELDVGKELGPDADYQKSYKDRETVNYGTCGSVRPDFCVGDLYTVEVKNYDIAKNMHGLIRSVSKQAIDRAKNLPEGREQRILIDIRGQVVSREQRKVVTNGIVAKSKGVISTKNIRFKENE